MKKLCVNMLAAMFFLLIPASLWACDCEDHTSSIVHFTDGLTPNGPVKGDPREAAIGSCSCSESVSFHDYGPAHVTPPPVVAAPPKHPNS